MTTTELAAALRSKTDPQRADAIAQAPTLGAPAISTIAPLLDDPDNEVFRAAKRALQGIVRRAGQTGSLGKDAAAVEAGLLASLAKLTTPQARRDSIWLLSEVGTAKTVTALSKLMTDTAVREDARCALERIPGNDSLKALKSALKSAPEDFKPAIAESLRKRGEKVTGYPSQRLTPTKTTTVKPGGE